MFKTGIICLRENKPLRKRSIIADKNRKKNFEREDSLIHLYSHEIDTSRPW